MGSCFPPGGGPPAAGTEAGVSLRSQPLWVLWGDPPLADVGALGTHCGGQGDNRSSAWLMLLHADPSCCHRAQNTPSPRSSPHGIAVGTGPLQTCVPRCPRWGWSRRWLPLPSAARWDIRTAAMGTRGNTPVPSPALQDIGQLKPNPLLPRPPQHLLHPPPQGAAGVAGGHPAGAPRAVLVPRRRVEAHGRHGLLQALHGREGAGLGGGRAEPGCVGTSPGEAGGGDALHGGPRDVGVEAEESVGRDGQSLDLLEATWGGHGGRWGGSKGLSGESWGLRQGQGGKLRHGSIFPTTPTEQSAATVLDPTHPTCRGGVGGPRVPTHWPASGRGPPSPGAALGP